MNDGCFLMALMAAVNFVLISFASSLVDVWVEPLNESDGGCANSGCDDDREEDIIDLLLRRINSLINGDAIIHKP